LRLKIYTIWVWIESFLDFGIIRPNQTKPNISGLDVTNSGRNFKKLIIKSSLVLRLHSFSLITICLKTLFSFSNSLFQTVSFKWLFIKNYLRLLIQSVHFFCLKENYLMSWYHPSYVFARFTKFLKLQMVLVKILASTQMGQKLSYNLQGKLPESQLS
jgi:hypothetical protein